MVNKNCCPWKIKTKIENDFKKNYYLCVEKINFIKKKIFLNHLKIMSEKKISQKLNSQIVTRLRIEGALMIGASINEISKKFDVHKGTVRSVKLMGRYIGKKGMILEKQCWHPQYKNN